MRSSRKVKWIVAIKKEELQALEEKSVWMVEVPPACSHVLKTKRVFKTDTDAGGKIEHYKDRLVACANE